MPVHTVLSHECINSIAARYGFQWRDIWEHPDNEGLRERRSNPDLLCAGDEIVIPDLEPRKETLATGRQHKLVVRNRLAALKLRFQYDGEPVSGTYVLEVAGRRIEGELSGEGQLEESIPAAAVRAKLLLVERNEEIDLLLGDLDPPDAPAGAVERLVNLGLLADRGDRELTPEVRNVLRLVQREEGLEPTGELDPETADALVRWHGC
jgi:hypothetical protein